MKILLLLTACFMGLVPAGHADDAPTRRLETVGVLGLPPTLDYKSFGARVYADDYRLVGSRTDRSDYLRVVLSASPEASVLLEKNRRRISMGTAIIVSGTGLYLASRVAESQPGAILGGAATVSGVGLLLTAPRVGRACDNYNAWSSEQGIPHWP